jgi:hypothetical protein
MHYSKYALSFNKLSRLFYSRLKFELTKYRIGKKGFTKANVIIIIPTNHEAINTRWATIYGL